MLSRNIAFYEKMILCSIEKKMAYNIKYILPMKNWKNFNIDNVFLVYT